MKHESFLSALGKKPLEVFSYPKKVDFQNLLISKKSRVEHYHKNGSKKVIWEVVGQAMYDEEGMPVWIEASSRDVTERENILQDLKKYLAMEKDLNQLKTTFISMKSHEFQTPLSTMLCSTELLNVYFNFVQENEVQPKVELPYES